MSFDDPAANAAFAEDDGFGYELWSDLDRSLALTYGAATSATQGMASRVTVLLDEDGVWRLEYSPASAATNPQVVLEDCEILFGS